MLVKKMKPDVLCCQVLNQYPPRFSLIQSTVRQYHKDRIESLLTRYRYIDINFIRVTCLYHIQAVQLPNKAHVSPLSLLLKTLPLISEVTHILTWRSKILSF